MIAWQAVEGEQQNMIIVPEWEDPTTSDNCIPVLVHALLDTIGPLGPDADLRQYTADITKRLADEHAAAASKSSSQVPKGESTSDD